MQTYAFSLFFTKMLQHKSLKCPPFNSIPRTATYCHRLPCQYGPKCYPGVHPHYDWVPGLLRTVAVCIIHHAGVGTCTTICALRFYTSNGFLLTKSLYFSSFVMHFSPCTGTSGLEIVRGSLQTNRGNQY